MGDGGEGEGNLEITIETNHFSETQVRNQVHTFIHGISLLVSMKVEAHNYC